MRPYVLNERTVEAYAPANHTGTSNRRIISKDSVGATRIEVLMGTITKGSGSLRHAHPGLEQATFLLQGGGINEVQGQVGQLGAGQWSLKPQGAFHRFDVTTDEPMKVIVIYSPPYLENPQQAVRFDERNPQPDAPLFVPAAGADTPAHPGPGITLSPVFTPALSGSRHMSIHDGTGEPHARVGAGRLLGRERVFFVKTGRLAGRVQDSEVTAGPGDFIFIPEGADWDLRCGADAACTFFRVDAYGAPPG